MQNNVEKKYGIIYKVIKSVSTVILTVGSQAIVKNILEILLSLSIIDLI